MLSAATGGFLGLLPHVLHHIGPLAGAALLTGAGGTALFGAIGFIAAIPFLLRVRRRTGAWRVPLTLLGLFAAMFTISALVIGPAISGDRGDDAAPARQERPRQGDGHDGHH